MEQLYGIVIVPLLSAVVEVIKRAFKLKKEQCPFISALLGVGLGFLLYGTQSVQQAVIVGLAFGLSASGFYDGTKRTFSFMFKSKKKK